MLASGAEKSLPEYYTNGADSVGRSSLIEEPVILLQRLLVVTGYMFRDRDRTAFTVEGYFCEALPEPVPERGRLTEY
jgi:hypothetical protein